MTNNHILRSIASGLKLNESKILEIFRHSDPQVSLEDVKDIFKAETEEDFVHLSDAGLAMFLDGLIYERRGGEKRTPEEEVRLDNNTILKKLRIALNLKEEDILKAFHDQEVEVRPFELTAFFRKKGHRNYRACSDKALKAFLKSLKEFS